MRRCRLTLITIGVRFVFCKWLRWHHVIIYKYNLFICSQIIHFSLAGKQLHRKYRTGNHRETARKTERNSMCWWTKTQASAQARNSQGSNKLHIEHLGMSMLCSRPAEGNRKCWTNFRTVFYIILIWFFFSPLLFVSNFWSPTQTFWSKSDYCLHKRRCCCCFFSAGKTSLYLGLAIKHY